MKFAKRVRDFVKRLPEVLTNLEYGRRLIRSSSSVGANYIKTNESFSKKDFVMRIKIYRREAKESRQWLRLVEVNYENLEKERNELINEAAELMKIFGSVVEKSKQYLDFDI